MRLPVFFFWGLILKVAIIFGQPVVFNEQSPDETDISGQTWIYRNPFDDNIAEFSHISRQKFARLHASAEETTLNDFGKSTKIIWKRFEVQNASPTDTLNIWYNVGAHAIANIFDGSGKQVATGGLFSSGRNGQIAVPLVIPPHTSQVFYVRLTDYVRVFAYDSDILYTTNGYNAFLAKETILIKWLLIALAMITGCLMLMGVNTLFQYYLTRDRAYLYYTFYAFVSFAFIVKIIDYRLALGLAPATMPQLTHPCLASLSFSVGFFYALFLSKLLDLPSTQPKIWRAIRIMMAVLTVQQLITFIEVYTGLWFEKNAYYLLCDLSGVSTGLTLIWAITRSKSPLKSYLLVGSISLFIISIAPFNSILSFSNITPVAQTFVNYPPFFMALGLLIELLCFALALAYRNRLTEIENKNMHVQYAQQLESDILARTNEIKAQSSLLQQQHIRQLETEFEQKLADTEMTALRAQMNPHFIFNCLNSIKLYTLQNNAERASDYLNKFARLIRLVLENSRSELVTLQNELDALQLYIELEAMRFKEKLKFEITVSNDIDQRYVKIPPLLLQPYVENAIWHGLMHKPEGGTIQIDVLQPSENLLTICIADDGVGRARAAELKSKSAGKHKSFGMQVTADRIQMINQLYNISTNIQILDLVDSSGQPLGTHVILRIPV
jgi:hypothetical protein